MKEELALKLYVVLSKAYKSAFEADKQKIKDYGLSPSEFASLELLYHRGPQPIQAIASKVLLSSGSMTYVVTQLEKKGLCLRRVSPDDRRVFFAEITESGKKLMAKILPDHNNFIKDLFSGLTEREAIELIEQLKYMGKAAAAHPIQKFTQ